MSMRSMTLRFSLICSTLTFSALGLADQGRLEINQDCALSGCFAGDTAGFPVTISASGSYVLVSGLTVSGGGSAIAVDVDQVKELDLDLNGFTIDGGGNCSGTPVISCAGGNAFNGIELSQNVVGNSIRLIVHNGTVKGFQNNGLAFYNFIGGAPLAPGSRIDRVTSTENANDGIGVEFGNGSTVTLTEVAVVRNGQRGFSTTNGFDGKGEFRRVLAYGNKLFGVAAPHGSSVVQSRLSENATFGLVCTGPGGTCTLAMGDNVFQGNGTAPYSVGIVRDMGGNVCIDAACP